MAKTIIIAEQAVVTHVTPANYASAPISIAEGITTIADVPNTLKIAFNGKEYVCEATPPFNSKKRYGATLNEKTSDIDFSDYPFAVTFRAFDNHLSANLATPSAGTYTVEVYTGGDAPKPTPKPSVVKRTPPIEESLLKLADKVDPDNKVEVSPNNLNPNYSIQRSLERIADSDLSGGGSGAGYTVETKAVAVVPEQTVTTKSSPSGINANLALAEGIEELPTSLSITFNGTQYECEADFLAENRAVYGGGVGETGPDFSEYPFIIMLETDPKGGSSGSIYTESAGTYTVKAEAVSKTVTVTDDFVKAVQKVISMTSTTGN